MSREPTRPCLARLEENNSGKFARAQTYNAVNRDVAITAAIRLLLGDKILPVTVAANTKIAETLMFAKFKYDQSIDIFLLVFIFIGEDALHASLVAARSSSIDE